MSTGRTFPTGVGAPALLEGLQDDREGTTPPVIHRSQALLGDVLVRDLLRRVTTAAAPGLCGGRATYQASAAGISVNGRYVTFVSAPSNLVTGDINSRSDVFVRDLYERTSS